MPVAVFLICPRHLQGAPAATERLCGEVAEGVKALMQGASIGANASFLWGHSPGVLVSARNMAEMIAAMDVLIARGGEIPELKSQRWEIKWSMSW